MYNAAYSHPNVSDSQQFSYNSQQLHVCVHVCNLSCTVCEYIVVVSHVATFTCVHVHT